MLYALYKHLVYTLPYTPQASPNIVNNGLLPINKHCKNWIFWPINILYIVKIGLSPTKQTLLKLVFAHKYLFTNFHLQSKIILYVVAIKEGKGVNIEKGGTIFGCLFNF